MAQQKTAAEGQGPHDCRGQGAAKANLSRSERLSAGVASTAQHLKLDFDELGSTELAEVSRVTLRACVDGAPSAQSVTGAVALLIHATIQTEFRRHPSVKASRNDPFRVHLAHPVQ
jgi:hypothetical protein